MTEDSDSDSNKDEDPFEELDEAVGDRSGDPFESLGDGSDDSANADPDGRDEPVDIDSPSPPTATAGDAESSPADGLSQDPVDAGEQPTQSTGDTVPSSGDVEPSGESSEPEFEPQDPSGMSFDVGRRSDAETPDGTPLSDMPDRDGDPFENVDQAFEAVDVGQLDPDIVWQELTSAESRGSVGDAQKRTYAAVSKHSYCEQCEHFSAPPDVYCKHEGTEIVEFLDMETVRVVDCPIVTEREKLEEEN